MPKNIVICADGTGNTTVKGRGTNVFKLYEAVDQNGHRFSPYPVQQVAIYHDGVGTEAWKWARILGGAFGWGLSRNVKQLYAELARVYDPGDRIYLFGFSRGAVTVRTLAGLVITCGILDPARYSTNRDFRGAIRSAYAAYRRKYQTRLSRLVRGKVEVNPEALRKRFSVAIPAFTDGSHKIIEFVGVWDTVDAVGGPLGISNVINGTFYRFKFPDLILSPQVARACHALALDEQRQSFEPVLWCEQPGDAERISQVWFAGVHSNVGGGYPRQGLSLVALDWMMRQAENGGSGLRFVPMARQECRDGTDVDDKLYDSRGGLGVFYRWSPRDAEKLSRDHNVSPKVHRTVYQRIARNTEGYAPGSVPPDADVVTSSSASIVKPLRELVAKAHQSQRPLVASQRNTVRVGQLTYWVQMLSVLGLFAYVVGTYIDDIRTAPDWKAAVVAVVLTIASTNWLGVMARTAWHHLWLVATALIGLMLTIRVAHQLDDRYSGILARPASTDARASGKTLIGLIGQVRAASMSFPSTAMSEFDRNACTWRRRSSWMASTGRRASSTRKPNSSAIALYSRSSLF